MKREGQFNYVALIAVIFAVLLAVLFLTRGFSTESGSVGLNKEVGVGEKAAPFAVPVAMSDLDGDANVDPEQACSVEGDDVLRICDYFDRPLVMSFWFTKGASSCTLTSRTSSRKSQRSTATGRVSSRSMFVTTGTGSGN